MIKEVVPLSEPFLTVFMITLENLDVTLGARVLISEDSKLISIGDMLLDLNRPKVKSLSRLYSDNYIFTHLFECFANSSQVFSSIFVFADSFRTLIDLSFMPIFRFKHTL